MLKSRGSGSFKLVPVSSDDMIVEHKNIMADLRGALMQVKEHLDGKRKMETIDSLIDELRDSSL